MSRVFGLFLKLMRALGVVTYDIRGIEHLSSDESSGRLIVANHPTLIDVVFLLWLTPNATCVVKRGLWRNPFLRWPVAWAGYIPNSESETLVQQCSASLLAGHSLVMFPEGSRSVPGEPSHLKRGAAQVAIAAPGVRVVPVVITCEPVTLTKTDPWYRVPEPRPHFTIAVQEPLPEGLYRTPGVPTSIAARHLTQHLATVFARRADPTTPSGGFATLGAPPAQSASL